MYRFNDPHAILRDTLLGFDAKQVLDAEFREIKPQPEEAAGQQASRLAALKSWFVRIKTGA